VPVVLLLAFVLVPLAEIYVIYRVGSVLGLPLTLAVLLLVSMLGAALVKREGLRAWRALRLAMVSGTPPTRELADGGLILLGGGLLLTPGFLTDAVGLLLVLPPTRAVARRMVTTYAVRRALRGSRRHARARYGRPRDGGRGPGVSAPGSPRRNWSAGQVIEGRVIDPPVADNRGTGVNAP
jgi:UPF0716 protein FxsA